MALIEPTHLCTNSEVMNTIGNVVKQSLCLHQRSSNDVMERGIQMGSMPNQTDPPWF